MSVSRSFNLQEDLPYDIGSRLYEIGIIGGQNYNAPCPVCDDKKTIVVKGIEIPCGYCTISSSTANKNNLHRLYIRDYDVEEFIINSVMLTGSENKGDYKGGNYPPLRVNKLMGFSKTKWSTIWVQNKNFAYLTPKMVDEEVTADNIADVYSHPDGVYTSKAKCERVVKMLHDYQRDLLKKFNEAQGTSYEYPFNKL